MRADRKTADWGTEPDYCQRKNSEKEKDGPSSKLQKNENGMKSRL